MVLRESGQMYLESVLVLSEKGEPVRSLDVANHLGFSKPSVSRAMGKLKNEGYIKIDPQGYITLTAKGESIARNIYEKRVVLKDFIMSLGVNEETAAEDACRIEHVLSDESFAALKEYIDRLEDCSALAGVSKVPARVKCAALAWHTLEDALNQ